MSHIASIVLLTASLCSAAIAQTADQAVQKGKAKQDSSANGSVVNAPAESGSVPDANGNGDADAAGADIQQKPVDKPLPFAVAELQLSVDEAGLHALLHGPEAGFVGVLGLSSTWDVTHPIAGLPPLLADAVVVAYGFTKTQDLGLTAPFQFVAGEQFFLYAQAVIIDAKGFWASGVVPLAIVASGSPGKVAADQSPVPAAH